MQKFFLASILLMACSYMSAQKVTSYSTTQEQSWKKAQTALSGKARGKVVADVKEQSKGTRFVAFGTTFNELDWDAFNMLTRKEQDEVMYNLFSPEGDLKFTHGRLSMNANDYAWMAISHSNTLILSTTSAISSLWLVRHRSISLICSSSCRLGVLLYG